MIKIVTCFVSFLPLLFSSELHARERDSETVQVESGRLRGSVTADVISFKGIPYAQPPVGMLRWKAPQPVGRWVGIRQAKAYGPECVQKSKSGQIVGSEDCLTLNVWTPRERIQRLPVMVFFYGGAFVEGSTSFNVLGTDIYDGSYVAEHGPVIVVTVNYRVGALGFMAHPDLSQETTYKGSGNYGLMDQIAALKWVKQNIAAFGGDPERVLIFGQSAGAIATNILLASPQAKGLFSRALIQSLDEKNFTLSQSEKIGRVISEKLGCYGLDALVCLRKKDAAEITTAQQGVDFGPTIDGFVQHERPIETFKNGEQHKVPVVIGTTADEFATVFPLDTPLTPQEFQHEVLSRFGAQLGAGLLSLYPSPSIRYPAPIQAKVAMLSDLYSHLPTRRFARALALSQPVWRYVYSHVFHDGYLTKFAAGHGQELTFIFHNFIDHVGIRPSPDELKLSDAMIGYWTRFAATGNPNEPSQNTWVRYDIDHDNYLNFDATIDAQRGFRKQECDVLESWGL